MRDGLPNVGNGSQAMFGDDILVPFEGLANVVAALSLRGLLSGDPAANANDYSPDPSAHTFPSGVLSLIASLFSDNDVVRGGPP